MQYSFIQHFCRTQLTLTGKQKRQLQEKLEYVQEVVKTKKVMWMRGVTDPGMLLVIKRHYWVGFCYNSLISPSRKSCMRSTFARVSAIMTWACEKDVKMYAKNPAHSNRCRTKMKSKHSHVTFLLFFFNTSNCVTPTTRYCIMLNCVDVKCFRRSTPNL